MRTKSVAMVAFVTALAARAGASEPSGRDTLVLKMVDTYSLCRTASRWAAEHVAEIFEDIGVSIRWEEPTTSAIPEPGQAELLVYLRPSRPESFGLDETAMGAVLDKRTPQRVLFVFLPSVARAIHVELDGGMMSALAERELARALSRVIVHEAFHAIAPELPHARTGLTAASLTRDALLKSKAEIELAAVGVFRKELAKLWVQAERQRTADGDGP